MSIRELAELTGQLVFAQPGVWVPPVFFKQLEIAKSQPTKELHGDYEGLTPITPQIVEDLEWWE